MSHVLERQVRLCNASWDLFLYLSPRAARPFEGGLSVGAVGLLCAVKSAEVLALLSLTERDQSEVTVQQCHNATLLLLRLPLLSSLFNLPLASAAGRVLTVNQDLRGSQLRRQ